MEMRMWVVEVRLPARDQQRAGKERAFGGGAFRGFKRIFGAFRSGGEFRRTWLLAAGFVPGELVRLGLPIALDHPLKPVPAGKWGASVDLFRCNPGST